MANMFGYAKQRDVEPTLHGGSHPLTIFPDLLAAIFDFRIERQDFTVHQANGRTQKR
jgi:hypothetical protein